jgi:hypothetical protein
MMSGAPTMGRVSGRLRLAVAGAVVVTALTAATAAAAPPGPMAAPAAGPTRPDPGPATGTPPRGFLLDRGRFTTFTIPGAQVTLAYGINDQGRIVGHSISGLPTAPTISGFLRDARGRLTAINRPGVAATAPFDINNRGQIVGVAGNP